MLIFRVGWHVFLEDIKANHWRLQCGPDAVPLADLPDRQQFMAVRWFPHFTQMGAHRSPLRQRVCVFFL
jgi:hypothetical protein